MFESGGATSISQSPKEYNYKSTKIERLGERARGIKREVEIYNGRERWEEKGRETQSQTDRQVERG